MTLTLGRRIAMARAGAKRTMQSVADALGCAKSTISNWENDLAEPSLTDIRRLSAELCVNQNWLAFGDGPIAPVVTTPVEVAPVPA